MEQKTALEREILVEWYHNKDATDEEIAEAVGCSASAVTEVKESFEDYDELGHLGRGRAHLRGAPGSPSKR